MEACTHIDCSPRFFVEALCGEGSTKDMKVEDIQNFYQTFLEEEDTQPLVEVSEEEMIEEEWQAAQPIETDKEADEALDKEEMEVVCKRAVEERDNWQELVEVCEDEERKYNKEAKKDA